MMGKDHTIFAVEDGMVKFDRSSVRARICVVAEEEYVPAKDTARARKFAKCVPPGTRAVPRCGGRALRNSRCASRIAAHALRMRSRVCGRAGSRPATPRPRRRAPPLPAEHTRGLSC